MHFLNTLNVGGGGVTSGQVKMQIKCPPPSSFHNHPKLTKQWLCVQQEPISISSTCHFFLGVRHALA
jgi:hypothetical protein